MPQCPPTFFSTIHSRSTPRVNQPSKCFFARSLVINTCTCVRIPSYPELSRFGWYHCQKAKLFDSFANGEQTVPKHSEHICSASDETTNALTFQERTSRTEMPELKQRTYRKAIPTLWCQVSPEPSMHARNAFRHHRNVVEDHAQPGRCLLSQNSLPSSATLHIPA